MAMTYAEFVKAANAQVVGGRIIVGSGADRRYVGTVENGAFALNAEGQALQEELEVGAREAAKPKAPKAPKPVPLAAESINDDLNFAE